MLKGAGYLSKIPDDMGHQKLHCDGVQEFKNVAENRSISSGAINSMTYLPPHFSVIVVTTTGGTVTSAAASLPVFAEVPRKLLVAEDVDVPV